MTKSERVIEAATRLFSRYGFRKTSMDLLAAEAQVAKPTLYAYFADKEAVFAAVCAHVAEQIVQTATAAAEGPGSREEKIARVLEAKHGRIFDLVHSSPHATEILESQERVAKEANEKIDRAVQKLVAGLVEPLKLDRVDLSPAALAALLVRSGKGLARDAKTRAALARDLDNLVRVVLYGL
jgi:AcrR family transcriptional regulator